MKIGIIGVGKMATAIIQGLKPLEIELLISQSHYDKTKKVAKALGVAPAKSHQELIEASDLVILGIKPQQFPDVLKPLTMTKPVMSMAAGITLSDLATLTSKKIPLIRIMPNLNAQIGKSTTAICFNDLVDEDLKGLAMTITNAFGHSFEISEEAFDTFTALAGSSPAYLYQFIEAMVAAGEKEGFDAKLALTIVSQTFLASSQMLLESQETPRDLITKIASPGGTTQAGLDSLKENHFSETIKTAIDATIKKAKNI
ncbi:pyrroline-5-carboxylate reductase [Streptococcus pacificus]|uniref:Pyrroline-5-carboxylate reductase n=1 Tax=Streptococcus pacificus TaxID=2740577 RepID=A0ABS0ZK98_9STRE|nr:pyrroline-5-carboxylate reductase [Streptococcus pacificus]MBJ8326387.1 pyrroline-5-carboxylate reductase [Streptococcus pacificus]